MITINKQKTKKIKQTNQIILYFFKINQILFQTTTTTKSSVRKIKKVKDKTILLLKTKSSTTITSTTITNQLDETIKTEICPEMKTTISCLKNKKFKFNNSNNNNTHQPNRIL